MGLLGFLKKKKNDEAVTPADPHHNPYQEKLLCTIPVAIEGAPFDLQIHEIKNKKAQVMGAQAVFPFQGSKVPVIVSSPRSENFSIGINIALHKALMHDFKEDLARLQEEGTVSPGAKLSYNPDTKNAILFRRSDAKVNGSVQRWQDICAGNIQTLINDFEALMPFVDKGTTARHSCSCRRTTANPKQAARVCRNRPRKPRTKQKLAPQTRRELLPI